MYSEVDGSSINRIRHSFIFLTVSISSGPFAMESDIPAVMDHPEAEDEPTEDSGIEDVGILRHHALSLN